jgi:peptidoglycan/LPS O-acetylase OafA/YrhL
MLLGASHFDSIVTYTCFDALGMGALLAWIRFYRPEKLGKTYQVLSILAPLSIVLLVISWYRIEWTVLPHRTLTAIVTLWIITHIIYNEPKGKLWFSVILNNGVLIFIGKISYGMYLYHNFVPYFTKRFFVEFNKRLPVLPFQPKVILAFEYFCLVVIMAWLSWKFIETPILHLKKYFVYTPQKTKVPRSKRLSDISI